MRPVITAQHLAQAFTYAQYRQLVDTLIVEGKTTGHLQKPVLVEYTRLNVVRMNRLDKTVALHDSLLRVLQDVPEPLLWVVLTEAWCPDSAQCVPVLAKISESFPKISLRLLLRDDNPDVMDAFLTNGSRSIPKLICLRADTGEELGTWGPRPAELQRTVMAHKADPQGVGHDEFLASVQLWYAKDKTTSLQRELEGLLNEWNGRLNAPKRTGNPMLNAGDNE